MQFTVPATQFGKTVVLAYPDTTRLGGYRAALGLWKSLGGDDSTTAKAQIDEAAEEIVETEFWVPGTDQIEVVIGTAAGSVDTTFVFVNGLPAAKCVPALVDGLLAQLEASGVERVVAVASANLHGLKGVNAEQVFGLAGVAGLPEISGNVTTGDALLSALDTLGRVSRVKVQVAVRGDKRPTGSGYRQRVEFGKEFADTDDQEIVRALGGVLAEAVGVGVADVSAPATRVRSGGEKAVQGLPAFG